MGKGRVHKQLAPNGAIANYPSCSPHASLSYATLSHRFTSPSISFSEVISKRCVIRSFFGKAAGIDQSLGCLFCITKREAEIDARLGRRFDLRKDVSAIERNDSLAWTGLHVFADLKSELQKRVIDWPQMFFLA